MLLLVESFISSILKAYMYHDHKISVSLLAKLNEMLLKEARPFRKNLFSGSRTNEPALGWMVGYVDRWVGGWKSNGWMFFYN